MDVEIEISKIVWTVIAIKFFSNIIFFFDAAKKLFSFYVEK